jgi:membrane dipeptidase
LRSKLWACLAVATLVSSAAAPDDVEKRARELHFSTIVLDTHDDTTQRFSSQTFELGKRNAAGSVDIPRMREGGMNAIFFSVWIDGKITGPLAIQKALDQIDEVHENVRRYSRDLMFARTAEEVRRAHSQGKIAVLIGVEGGHMIGNDIRMVRIFGDLGVRYMTLSHFHNTEWADSSTDKPAHNGLSDSGKQIVREMNRQGILVDISHVADKTFYDALEISAAPLIASHSSCRAICNHPRNMSDEMIKALAAKGGVIQINYEMSFLDQAFKDAFESKEGGVVQAMDRVMKECGPDDECQMLKAEQKARELIASGALPRVSWERIIEHIDHVVQLVGPDHVGLGSDFDGAIMPEGMEDCSKLPKITDALLRKGYSEDAVRKILGGNLLRVMEAAERTSREMLGAP